jgi:hypothetical protein
MDRMARRRHLAPEERRLGFTQGLKILNERWSRLETDCLRSLLKPTPEEADARIGSPQSLLQYFCRSSG